MIQAVGGGNVNGKVDAGAPRRGAERLNDAGAAQDADAVEHAQPGVGSLFSDLFAVGHGDTRADAGIGRPTTFRQTFSHGVGHHPARDAGYRRLADLNAGAGPGHCADARAAGNLQTLVAVGETPDADDDLRAVGDVGVIAPRP